MNNLIRVLLLEDDKSVCDTLKEAIEHLNHYTVDCAHTIVEAKRLLTMNEYDVICLDLLIDGELSTDILDLHKKNTLILSAWKDVEKIATSYNVDFLIKPFDLHELEKKILTILKQSNKKRAS